MRTQPLAIIGTRSCARLVIGAGRRRESAPMNLGGEVPTPAAAEVLALVER